MRRILLAVFVSFVPTILLSQNAVRIHGCVSDFDDMPIGGAHVSPPISKRPGVRPLVYRIG
jgi:hypothetical protein